MPNKLNWIDIGRNVMRMEGEGGKGRKRRTAYPNQDAESSRHCSLADGHFLVLLLVLVMMMMAMLFHSSLTLTVSQRHLNERSELQQS